MERKASSWRSRAQPWLGTLVDIRVDAGDGTDDANRPDAPWLRATAAAFDRIAVVHRSMSFHERTSDLRRIARASAGSVVEVGRDTWRVLRLARALEHASGGVFNAAIAPRMVASGLLPMPDDARRPQALGLVEGLRLLPIGPARLGAPAWRVEVVQPVWIDLGGIAKGYAVDRAVAALRAHGVGAGIVNAGGDMRAFGPQAHLVHLRFERGFKGVAELRNGALASSCNADRLGVSPHLDARDGRPVRSRQTVVVQARSAALADSLTKVAMACPAAAARLMRSRCSQWRAFDYFDA